MRSNPTRSLTSLPRHLRSLISPPSVLAVCFPLSSPLSVLLLSMAGDSESFNAGAVLEDEKYGFSRPEMYKSSLAGTVDAYDRHVFLCYKGPESWSSRVEDSDVHPLPKLFSAAVKARQGDIAVKTKLTVRGGDGYEFSDGDVLIFPQMIKYKGINESTVDGFVDDVIVGGKPWASGMQEVLTGSHVFVCAHGSRDKRCGVCGPALIEKLEEEIDARGLKNQVFVSPCSHVGGHKYAGNLIIYSPNPDGKITGHWYGYVTPGDVPELLDQHIGKGEIIDRLWRGQMGAPVEEEGKGNEEKLLNGEEKMKKKERHQESSNSSVMENAGSCCGGSNGFSCCRDVSSEEKKRGLERDKKGNWKLSSWMGSWEQTEVLTAVAVVGAVATVVAAYCVYRRSGR